MVEAPDHGTCQKYVAEVVNMICEKVYKAVSTALNIPTNRIYVADMK